jgi:hypothetical protein
MAKKSINAPAEKSMAQVEYERQFLPRAERIAEVLGAKLGFEEAKKAGWKRTAMLTLKDGRQIRITHDALGGKLRVHALNWPTLERGAKTTLTFSPSGELKSRGVVEYSWFWSDENLTGAIRDRFLVWYDEQYGIQKGRLERYQQDQERFLTLRSRLIKASGLKSIKPTDMSRFEDAEHEDKKKGINVRFSVIEDPSDKLVEEYDVIPDAHVSINAPIEVVEEVLQLLSKKF